MNVVGLPFGWSPSKALCVLRRLQQLGCGPAGRCLGAWNVVELLWEQEPQGPEFAARHASCGSVMCAGAALLEEVPAAFSGAYAFERLCERLDEQLCLFFVVQVVESLDGGPALWVSNLLEFRLAQFVHLFHGLEGYGQLRLAESMGVRIRDALLEQSRRRRVRRVRVDFFPLQNALLGAEDVLVDRPPPSPRAEVAWANFWLRALHPVAHEESLELYLGGIPGFVREHCPLFGVLQLFQDIAERRFKQGRARRNALRVLTLRPLFPRAAEDMAEVICSFL